MVYQNFTGGVGTYRILHFDETANKIFCRHIRSLLLILHALIWNFDYTLKRNAETLTHRRKTKVQTFVVSTSKGLKNLTRMFLIRRKRKKIVCQECVVLYKIFIRKGRRKGLRIFHFLLPSPRIEISSGNSVGIN